MSMVAFFTTVMLHTLVGGIESAVLSGENVCIFEEEYNVTMTVEERVPKEVKYYVWCLRLPPRCTRYRTQIETVYKDKIETKTRGVEGCCEGYSQVQERCAPECPQGCVEGSCSVPGVCSCQPGFTGPDCSSACQADSWGSECGQNCSCSNNSTCDPTSGVCLCAPGWVGDACDLTCDAGTYGLDCSQRCTCQNGAVCHHVSGRCSCPPGYLGSLCDFPCPKDRYGENCSLECPCKNGADCNPVTGDCTCSPGWKGMFCEAECEEGRYGPGCQQLCDCDNAVVCDRFNGTCHCTPGFTGEKCAESCRPGTYGPRCQGQCDCSGSPCDSVTGLCSCPSGWEGTRCDHMICQQGYYGPNCTRKCQCHYKYKNVIWGYLDRDKKVPATIFQRKQNRTIEVDALTDKQVLLLKYGNNGDFTSLAMLCAQGLEANIADVNNSYKTPLHLAAEKGHVSAVLTVMECGGYINAYDENNNTPLHLAVTNSQFHAASVLLHHEADPFLPNKDGNSAYQLAWKSENQWMKYVFQEHRFKMYHRIRLLSPKEKKLHYDVKKGYYGNVADICMSGVDIQVGDVDNHENTALHVGAQFAQNIVPMVLTLIRCGADVNARNADGDTALHIAVKSGHLNATSSLLYNKVDISIENNKGQTVLDLAQQSTDPSIRAMFSEPLLHWYMIGS